MAADPQGVRTGLAQAEGYLNQWARSADKTFKNLGSAGDGVTMANNIVAGLESRFLAASNSIRESLFRGVFSPTQAKREAGIAAQAYNTALLGALEGFRSKGFLGEDITHTFVSKLSDAGLKAGEQFAGNFNAQLDRFIDGSAAVSKLGRNLTVGVTLPIVAAGGLGIKEAIDGQTEMNRLQIAFGDDTAYVLKQLDALHDAYPAQRHGLEGMAAGAGLALESVGILGKRAIDMSLNLERIAGALALVHNADPADVMQGLERVLAGNTRGLIQYDVILKQNAITQEAQRLGLVKHGEQLNDTARALAAYSALQRATAAQVEKSASVTGSAASQLRFLKRDALEAVEALGVRLLPAFTELVRMLDGVAKHFANLPTGMQDTIITIGLVVAAIGPLLFILGQIGSGIGVAIKAIQVLKGAEGFFGLATTLAAGGPVLLALAAVLAAVLAIRYAMDDSDRALGAFEKSLAGFSATQLSTAGADLGKQIDDAYRTRARILEQSKNPGALGLGGGGALSSQLSSVNEQIELLEAKSATVSKALAALKTASGPKTVPLPNLGGGDPFKDLVAGANEHLAQLGLIGERYDDIDTRLETTGDLVRSLGSRFGEQRPLVDLLRADVVALNRTLDDSTRTVEDKAKALTEVLKIQKAINAATSVTPQLEKISGFASAQLGGLGSLGNIDALQRAQDDAAAAFTNIMNDFTAGLIPATAKNLGAINALSDALAKAGAVIDAAHPLLPIPRTVAERAGDTARGTFNAGVDSSQTASAVARAALTTEFTNSSLIFKRAANEAQTALLDFARTLAPANLALATFNAVTSLTTTVIGSVLDALNPFSQVASAISNAAKPIAPVLAKVAAIVGEVLRPVFEAFAPVLEALLPLFTAILQVIGPILKALAPLFGAFIPILNALFPVFKLVGIVLTYLGQAIAITSGVIFKVIGAFATVVGGLIAAIGSFISHIPFLGGLGRDIQDFGNGIKNFGHGALDAADQMFKASDEFARARTAIENTTIDTAAGSIARLGNAADAVTAQLLNVPAGYKVAQARYEASLPVHLFGSTTPTPEAPGGSGSSGSSAGAAPVTIAGDILIDARQMTPSQLFDAMISEGRKRARAAGKSNWWEVQT